MGNKSFNKMIHMRHAKLMKWAERNGVRFTLKSEKEREDRGRGRNRR